MLYEGLFLALRLRRLRRSARRARDVSPPRCSRPEGACRLFAVTTTSRLYFARDFRDRGAPTHLHAYYERPCPTYASLRSAPRHRLPPAKHDFSPPSCPSSSYISLSTGDRRAPGLILRDISLYRYYAIRHDGTMTLTTAIADVSSSLSSPQSYFISSRQFCFPRAITGAHCEAAHCLGTAAAAPAPIFYLLFVLFLA